MLCILFWHDSQLLISVLQKKHISLFTYDLFSLYSFQSVDISISFLITFVSKYYQNILKVTKLFSELFIIQIIKKYSYFHYNFLIIIFKIEKTFMFQH